MVTRKSPTSIRRRAFAWSAALVVLAASLAGLFASARIVAMSCFRGELQGEADRTALELGDALASQADVNLASFSGVSNRPITLGQWDATRRQFRPSADGVNAVEVVVQRAVARTSGDWLSRLFASGQVAETTHAVVSVRPRDIVFVVDLSGAMTGETRAALEHLFHLGVEDSAYSEDRQLRLLYADLGFDAYPGTLEPLGAPWRVGEGRVAYETLIAENGPLADLVTDERYRIDPADPVSTRRRKAYRAVIERQVMRVMPQARPRPDRPENFEHWAAYLDEVLASDDSRARLGYASYIRFMLKHGRCIQAGGQHVALSQYSDESTWHPDLVEGLTLQFPPRTQPMHDVRRGLLVALQNVASRNRAIEPGSQRDRVAIVTFDSLSPGGAWVEQPLTCDYLAASNQSARLQAVGERAQLTTGLAGLRLAEALLRQSAQVSRGSRDASQQVVLVTAKPIQNEEVLHAQLAKMSRLGQSVSLIWAGPEGKAGEARLPFRDAVGSASVVLVQ